MTMRRYEKFFDFEKVDEGSGIVYGWAIVCTVGGEPYIDLQGDHIPVSAMLDATAAFMGKSARPGLDMHEGEARGDIVFGLPVTEQTRKQLGMTTDREGFYIGWKPRDEAAMELVKSGARLGFSIGGWIEEATDVDITKGIFGSVVEPGKREQLAKAKGKAGTPKDRYRMFARFHLDEISIVDRPAQEGAMIGFVKRHVIAQSVSKRAVATSSDRGHQHLIDPACIGAEGTGYTMSAEMLTSNGPVWHSHDVIADGTSGKITILDNAGHGHTVGDDVVYTAPTKATEGKPTPTTEVAYVTANDKSKSQIVNPGTVDSLTPKIATASVTTKSETPEKKPMTPEQIAELNANLAKFQILASLNDAEKLYVSKLAPHAADQFFKSDLAVRGAILKADEVVYTADDGSVYRKSDDPRLIASAKRADDTEKKYALEAVARKRAEFSKAAAEDLGFLTGESTVHAAIIEAIETGISDETLRKSARDALRAANVAMAKLAKTTGSRGETKKAAGADQNAHNPAADTVQVIEKALNDAVEEYRKMNKCVSFEHALMKATQSDAGIRKLYDELAEAQAADRN